MDSDDDLDHKSKKSKKDKKEKKEKKDKRDKEDKNESKHSSSNFNPSDLKRKSSFEMNIINEENNVRKKFKDNEGTAKSVNEESDLSFRRRTRSISDADEKYLSVLSPEAFRKEHQITISGTNDSEKGPFIPPDPMTLFSQTPFSQPIKRVFDASGFLSPTATQAQSWPIALSGRDIITVAKTGSGKTIGFLLPAFHRLLNSESAVKRGTPRILVLAPTRELAVQIEEECVKFGRTSNIRSACCYGGSPKSIQIRKIQQGLEVIIATPGRLNDLLEMKVVNLSQIVFLVLDEADRMLDMGFEPQIRSIIAQIPTNRQSMMFTATWPREVQALAREFLRNPIEIKFGDSNQLNANKAIIQKVIVVQNSEKSDRLKSILTEVNPEGKPEKIPKTIIFVSRKHSCDDLANELWNAGYSVDSLHGDKQQFLRTKVMDKFKRSDLRILVATDVAARGLDVKDIEVVINYDFPAGTSGVEDYVHRIGRTGRAGATGKSFTFFTKDDSKRASQLIGVLKRAGQEVPEELQKFGGWGGFGGGRGGGRGGRGGFGGGRGSSGGFRGRGFAFSGGRGSSGSNFSGGSSWGSKKW
jgi:ATP-dependent RNA helicase DDX5/DBP2